MSVIYSRINALFPNMTVEENIAAGFKYRPGQKMTAEEIKRLDGRLYGTAACDRVKILLSGKIIRRAAAACGAGKNPCVRPGGFDAG
mgnify:CR=1 FL=1